MKRLLASGLAISLGGCLPSLLFIIRLLSPERHPYGPPPAPSYQSYHRRRAISDRLKAINRRLRLVATSPSH